MVKRRSFVLLSIPMTILVTVGLTYFANHQPGVRPTATEPAVTTALRGPAVAAAPAVTAVTSAPPAAVAGPDLLPLRIRIPSISVEGPIRAAGLTSGGNLPAPEGPAEVDWFKGSPAPGSPGNAILTGHVDWYNGASAIFTGLARLRPGDVVEVVGADRVTRSFTVDAIRSEPLDSRDSSLFQPSESSTITLITCAGNWLPNRQTYDQRILVTARAVVG